MAIRRLKWAQVVEPEPEPPAPGTALYGPNVHASRLLRGDRLELYAEVGSGRRPGLWELHVVSADGTLLQVLWKEHGDGDHACLRARGQGWRGNDQPPQV